MKRTATAIAIAAAVAAVVLAPVLLLANTSSCSVEVTSYADAIINPPKGEDTEFFVSSGGVPNIMFVLDSSGSMIRMPPDGASMGWGSFETSGNTVAGAGYGCSNAYANTRVFNSPCGTTTLEGSPYNMQVGSGWAGPVFALAADSNNRYCPYMVSGNQPPATDKPGFDPDFYPTFFETNRVYRDEAWSDTSTSPEPDLHYTAFCSGFAGDKGTSCTTCFRDRGYWFDGTYQSAWGGRACGTTAECARHGEGVCVSGDVEYNAGGTTGTCQRPTVYFVGNFLNFYPPKFIVARKVLKDVLMNVRRIRLGLATFNGSTGGDLIDSLNPGCNMFGSPSSFDSNRSSVKNDINNTNKVNFRGATPLAETLFNVGQYYRTSALPWFDSAYKVAAWEEKASNNRSVCFSCQASAVLLITDGIPNRDGHIPGTDYSSTPMDATTAAAAGSYAGMTDFNITGITCPSCESWAELPDTAIAAGQCNGNQETGACDDSGNPIVSYLPRVAWYLKNMDFRSDTELGADGLPFRKHQGITTYTIGLATRTAASKILQDTAEAGGGLYNGGTGADVSDAKTLREAIMKVLEDVNTRSTSFGAASLSTLQVASTQGVLIPRFEPSRSAHWDGHLYAFDLYSEFSSGTCTPMDPSVSGPANGDYDCDGKCQSVFLKDADGSFISEDSAGAFRKNKTPGRALCGNGSRCSAGNCSEPPDSTDPLAAYFWDAGSKLAPEKKVGDAWVSNSDFATNLEWNSRDIYTVIDDVAPIGKFTSADPLLNLRTDDPVRLVPYLNIRRNSFCSSIATRLQALGNPAGSTITAEVALGNYATCARTIIDFVRGADVFNERGCSTYPGTYCTRRYQLGDIFHSSPVEVWAPLASDGWACPRGQHPQCLPSLFSASISNPSLFGHANAYDDYSKSDRYKTRKKFALVGANDGMLHAFRMERTDSRKGEEIWAFIPPDLLPKIKLLMESTHHFYVDATPMVRDVWLDGVGNGLGSGDPNGIRHRNEFHTVAVVGERRGGTHYFALDVTDAADANGRGDPLDAKPKFLWLYPQPDDPEELAFGETYVEFLPKPPPIGPVRIDKGATPCPRASDGQVQAGGATRCFEEKWVVLLPGGFDPQYTKGRGVHMVDVGTGEEIWDFSQGPGNAGACTASDDPRCHLNFPVAATPGMMMWGTQPQFLSAAAVDGYFDTATVGDTGGQLWVLRFNDPGIVDPGTGKVGNWYGARAFQTGLTSTAPGVDYCGGQPFFYITSNLPLAANGLYRTLAGTGDRFNILDPLGGVCGPDNIRACMLKGCTVKLEDPTGGAGAVYGVETLLGTQSYHMDHPALCSGFLGSSYSYARTPRGALTCGTVTSRVNGLVISCPSGDTCSGSAETTTKRVGVTCTADSCTPSAANDTGNQIDLKGNPDKRNWFYSIQVFERSGARTVFRTDAEAKAYDAARLSESDLKNVNPYDTTRAAADLATPEGRGWSYYFDHGRPSTPDTVVLDGVTHQIYRTDERTASVSQVEYGCAFWNTLQAAVPTNALDATTGCPVNSPCKAGRPQVSYLYGANAGTGGLCMQVGDQATRSSMTETLVPPTIGKMVAYVGQGQVAFGLTSVRVPQGGANVQLGDVQDLVSPVEWLPVDRRTHDCRHTPKTGTPAPDNASCR